MACGPRAFCPVEYRPTIHRYARRAVRTCHVRVVGQRGACSSPRLRPRRGSTNVAIYRRRALLVAVATAFDFRGARPARSLPRAVSADRPLSTRAAHCGLGVVVLWANEGRCRRPRLDRTNTATGRRHGVLKVAAIGLDTHGERHVRFSRRGVTTDRSQSTRALLCRLGVAMCPMRGALLPTPSSEARPHYHHDRTAARRSNLLWRPRSSLVTHGPLAFRPVEYWLTTHEARATRRSADLAWLCCGPTQRALLSTPSARARPHQHRHTPEAQPSERFSAIAFKSRGARPARFLPRGVSADGPLSTRAAQAGFAWLCCGPTRDDAVGRGSVASTPPQADGTEFGGFQRSR